MQNSAKKKHGQAHKTELEYLRQKITDLIHEKPDKAAKILSLWLAESIKRAAPKKK